MTAIHFSDLISWNVNTEGLNRSDRLILKYSRLYFFMAIFQLCIVFTANLAIILHESINSSTEQKISMYSYIYIIVVFHQLWLVWDGVHYTNIIEIYGFVVLNVLYIYYGSLQIYDLRSNSKSGLVLAMSIISIATMGVVFYPGGLLYSGYL